MDTLWTDELSAYDGKFYQLRECIMYPKPVQTPSLPITVGGHSEGALRRAAKYGAGWYGINLSPEESKAMVEKLDEHLVEQGRAAGDLRIVVGTTLETVHPETITRYHEAGVDEVLIPFVRQCHKWLEAYLESLSPFVDAAAACS